MAYLARLLAADGCEVRTWGLPAAPGAAELEEALRAERIVLPVPMAKAGRLSGTELPLGELWSRLHTENPVYAGAVDGRARAEAEARGLRVVDYMKDEPLAIRNAVPTAEGALAAAMERLSVTLHGTSCLVIGFGRVGKLLAKDLAALGARVSVSARRFDDIAWIDALGYEPLHTARLAGRLSGFRAVFNTVPHMVLDEALLRELRQDCVLLELASQPGIDTDAARALGLDYTLAGGLPGRAAPETAALALRETLYRLWEDEKQ